MIIKTTPFKSLVLLSLFTILITSISPSIISAQDNPEKPKDKKKKEKTFKDFVTEKAVSDTGLFNTHKVDSKLYFEIADSLLEREILVVSRISGTIDGFNFGGAGMKAQEQQVWRFQKKDDQILLRSVSYNSVASEEKPIYESVRNNNFEPLIMVFKIKSKNDDSTSTLIQVNELFTSDVSTISPLSANQRKNFGVRMLDKKRSLIMWTKSFPKNTEIRHILTYSATKLPSNRNTNTLSIEMNQSMILLPKVPMIPRMYDRRVGFFSVSQIDYGLDEQKATNRRYITKWRLEPKDVAAFKRGELVEPKKQIVYYIDPATPMKWRKYLKQGVEDWQKAFESAGFKNAIIAKDPPTKEEDPDWSPEDVRYSVIRYTANPIQNAMGPHVHDPRSGEILESDIIWYHNVMRLLRNWFFIQTAAVNPDARKVKFDDHVMGKLVRFVSAHEVGHTLGFPHNMGASSAYPVDSLRSASFTKENGVSPSIMDYARFNYVAQPGDGAYLFPAIGKYDKWAVKWGYTPFLDAKTTEDETDILNAWAKEKGTDKVYWFGSQTFNPIDPRAQTEDIGDDAMKSSTYGIANLKRITEKLITWTEEDGKNYDDLQELYNNVIGQWNRYNGHVKSNVGGIYQTHKTYDQAGNVYEYVPKKTQQRAMKWISKNVFETPAWLLNNDILKRIEGAGAVDRIRRMQVTTLNNLLDPSRLQRLIESETLSDKNVYTPLQMMDDLKESIWSELKKGKKIDTFRRNLQRAYLDQLVVLMEKQQPYVNPGFAGFVGHTRVNVSQSDIRPLVRAELTTLKNQIKKSLSKSWDSLSRYHLEDAVERIELILDPNN